MPTQYEQMNTPYNNAYNDHAQQKLVTSCMPTVGAHAKKTTDTLTVTSNYRHFVTQTDFTTGLTRFDKQCNRTRTQTSDQKEKRKALASHI